jgi:hypothetical protein
LGICRKCLGSSGIGIVRTKFGVFQGYDSFWFVCLSDVITKAWPDKEPISDVTRILHTLQYNWTKRTLTQILGIEP